MWTKTDDAYCPNNKRHDHKLKNLPECQRLCIEDDDCIGVLFSTFYADTTGESNCYFCKDGIIEYDPNNDLDFYLRPGTFINIS